MMVLRGLLLTSSLAAVAGSTSVQLAHQSCLVGSELTECFLLGYVGPGAGLSMLGALLAVACVVFLALLGPILYPIRLVRSWLRKRRECTTSNNQTVEPSHSTSARHNGPQSLGEQEC